MDSVGRVENRTPELDDAPFGILTIGSFGAVPYINRAAQDLLGAEVVLDDQEWLRLIAAPERLQLQEQIDNVRVGAQPSASLGVRTTATPPRWLTVSVRQASDGTLVVGFVDATELHAAREREAVLQSTLDERLDDLEALRGRLADTLGRLVHTADLERRRIAAELHDTAMQQVAAALLLLDLSGPDAVASARQHLEGAVSSARDLIDSIRPPLLDELGVGVAIREELERVRQSSDCTLEISYSEDLAGIELGGITEALLWRSVVDTMRAARQDPAVTVLTVFVRGGDREVIGRVSDDGGSTREMIHPTGALTAIGVARETILAAGGTFDLRQGSDGTRVLFTIPVIVS